MREESPLAEDAEPTRRSRIASSSTSSIGSSSPFCWLRSENGTWQESDLLNEFHIEFPGDDDLGVRVRINEEDAFWSHPRAAHDLEPGATTQPNLAGWRAECYWLTCFAR
jgi:hypothetical protein